jgi:hypothetical protein
MRRAVPRHTSVPHHFDEKTRLDGRLIKVRRILIVGAAVAATLLVASPAHAVVPPKPQKAAIAAGCTGNIQQPHVSNGAKGGIAKADFVCSKGHSTKPYGAYLYLYLCPRANMDTDRCTLKEYEGDGGFTVGTKPVTRYVPKDLGRGAHGNGYWVAMFRWDTPPSRTAPGRIILAASPWVKING